MAAGTYAPDRTVCGIPETRNPSAFARTLKAIEGIIRVASNRINAERLKTEKLQRTEAAEDSDCVWPSDYTLVMVLDGDRKVIEPIRYQCRLPGWTAADGRPRPPTTLAAIAAEAFGSASTVIATDYGRDALLRERGPP